uniref:Chemosensory protein 12 n=1 Tax=Heliconius charithonia TaxID=33434 RepID=A0AA49IYD3_HELCH|nr:chemosensory protein 12 [Heliconius charithonia]
MHILLQCVLTLLLVYQYLCETYTTKYDGVDLDEILASDRLLTGYVKCLLDNGPCTPDGKELKKNLPDAIDNDCKKCTEKQRNGADKVMHYIIDHRPEDWDKLEKKYNADGTYKLKYLASKEMEISKIRAKENVTEVNEEEYEEENYGTPGTSIKE